MTVYSVSNASELQAAMASVIGGDRVVLASGDYGNLQIINKNYASNVTIEAAAGASPAHLDGLFVQNVTNLTVKGLDLGRALNPGEPDYTQLNYIRNSSNIKLDGITVHGSYDNEPANDGFGIVVTGVTNIQVVNSHFEELYRGMNFRQCENVFVEGNDIVRMRSDGFVVSATDNITFDGNHFSEFMPQLPDHADFIQFWNIGETRGSNNITIKNNEMMQEYFSGVSQTGVQGIWISDPEEYGYKNVLIQNNILWSNDAYNGISVIGGDGVQILGNTVVSKATDVEQFWIRMEYTNNLVIEGNVTDNIITKNVTNYFQHNNINFGVEPGLRGLIGNLETPASASELLVDGVGYHAFVTPAPGAVSSAMSSGLKDLLSAASGTSLSHAPEAEAKAALVDMQPVSPYAVDLFAPVHTALASGAGMHIPGGGGTVFLDHYVAMV